MRVSVRVFPNSRVNAVGGRYGHSEPPTLIVRVSAAAVAGKANQAVVEELADAFGVKRSQVRIVAGARGRTKVVELEGADPAVLTRLTKGAIPGSA